MEEGEGKETQENHAKSSLLRSLQFGGRNRGEQTQIPLASSGTHVPSLHKPGGRQSGAGPPGKSIIRFFN